MNTDISTYNAAQVGENKEICEKLFEVIVAQLPKAESKVWHGAPVWFLDGNPVVGYDVLKSCVRLLFWSGQSFEESALNASGTFKAAEARYISVAQIDIESVRKWLQNAQEIQWDYKNIVKNRGVLNRLK